MIHDLERKVEELADNAKIENLGDLYTKIKDQDEIFPGI